MSAMLGYYVTGPERRHGSKEDESRGIREKEGRRETEERERETFSSSARGESSEDFAARATWETYKFILHDSRARRKDCPNRNPRLVITERISLARQYFRGV